MKRVATILFSLIVLGHLVQPANAQMRVATSHAKPFIGTLKNSVMPITWPSLIPSIDKGAQPQATQTDAISYFQDTTGDNWWIYAPVFSAGPDSLGYVRFGDKLYLEIADTIGPITINLGNGQTETDFDTMYRRVMALRVSTPTDITPTSARLDSTAITVFPISMGTNDSIVFWVVPMADVQFSDAQGNPTGVYPIPDFFGTKIAAGSIHASDLVMNDLNTVTVKFGHKAIGSSRKHFGICMFVDGAELRNDTLGYVLDANAQPLPGTFAIDTDGTLGTFSGVDGPIQMRTYHGQLDQGHLLLGGSTQPSLVGGISGFFVANTQFDPNTGNPSGNYFAGNLVMTTYISGTSKLAVLDHPSNGYSLNDVYPNPISSTAEISYTLGNSGNVSLKMYNQLGQQVGNFIGGMQGQGDHTAAFNVSNLPNGVYYYVLSSGDFTSSKTMVVSH